MTAKLRKGEIRLKAVRPSAAVTAQFRGKLDRLIDQMAASVSYWITRAYKAHPPALLAQDDIVDRSRLPEWTPPTIDVRPILTGAGTRRFTVAVDGDLLLQKNGRPRQFTSAGAAERAAKIELGIYMPAEELNEAMTDLATLWQSKFDALAPKMARHFATQIHRRSDTALRQALKDGGMSVDFQPTPAMIDVAHATVAQNVELIKSIPQKYLTQVQGAVMRSVQAGRDLGPLTDYLVEQRGITKRRAANIALDQNNKATSAMQRVRQTELGIEEAIWRHSQAGKHPRPKHLAANGTRYKVSEGLPIGDKGQNVWPGEEIHCRCVSISVVPGFAQAPIVNNPAGGIFGGTTSSQRWSRRYGG